MPISAIVTYPSTTIETCRSPRLYETDKTTRTCHAARLVHDAGMLKLRCMSQIWHHRRQQGSSLDVPSRKKFARYKTHITARKLRMQTANATVALRSDDNSVFRHNIRLTAAFKCKPWRTNTETHHTTHAFPSGSETQLLVKEVATLVAPVIRACFQLSSQNITERQLERAT